MYNIAFFVIFLKSIFNISLTGKSASMLQFDILFNDLGEIGLAQILIVLVVGCTTFSSGINSLATVFIAYEPNFR